MPDDNLLVTKSTGLSSNCDAEAHEVSNQDQKTYAMKKNKLDSDETYQSQKSTNESEDLKSEAQAMHMLVNWVKASIHFNHLHQGLPTRRNKL